MEIKNGNYITIQKWMITKLNLAGNSLLVYAIIYEFSQREGTWYDGGLQYLANWTNSTKQGVLLNLKKLLEKGFIEKEEYKLNNIKFVKYRAKELDTLIW